MTVSDAFAGMTRRRAATSKKSQIFNPKICDPRNNVLYLIYQLRRERFEGVKMAFAAAAAKVIGAVLKAVGTAIKTMMPTIMKMASQCGMQAGVQGSQMLTKLAGQFMQAGQKLQQVQGIANKFNKCNQMAKGAAKIAENTHKKQQEQEKQQPAPSKAPMDKASMEVASKVAQKTLGMGM
jgi:hypothetical protein